MIAVASHNQRPDNNWEQRKAVQKPCGGIDTAATDCTRRNVQRFPRSVELVEHGSVPHSGPARRRFWSVQRVYVEGQKNRSVSDEMDSFRSLDRDARARLWLLPNNAVKQQRIGSLTTGDDVDPDHCRRRAVCASEGLRRSGWATPRCSTMGKSSWTQLSRLLPAVVRATEAQYIFSLKAVGSAIWGR